MHRDLEYSDPKSAAKLCGNSYPLKAHLPSQSTCLAEAIQTGALRWSSCGISYTPVSIHVKRSIPSPHIAEQMPSDPSKPPLVYAELPALDPEAPVGAPVEALAISEGLAVLPAVERLMLLGAPVAEAMLLDSPADDSTVEDGAPLATVWFPDVELQPCESLSLKRRLHHPLYLRLDRTMCRSQLSLARSFSCIEHHQLCWTSASSIRPRLILHRTEKD